MRVRHILSAVALLLAAASPCAARPVVSLRADIWCPYNCAAGSDHPGYAVEIAQAVFNAAGFDVDYQLLNWTRSIDEVRQGAADAVIGAYSTDVAGFVLPDEPIGRGRVGFAARQASAFHYTGPQSLVGRRLGIVASYDFPGALGDYLHTLRGDKSRIQYMSGERALAKNLLKLISGRVDLVLDDARVLERLINELQLQDQVTFTEDRTSLPVYIAFSPASPNSARYARILSAGIVRLRASGQLAAILARYGLQDWNTHVRR